MDNKTIDNCIMKWWSEESDCKSIITNNKIIISPFISPIYKFIILFWLFQITWNFLELYNIIDVSKKDNQIPNIILWVIINLWLIIWFLVNNYYNSKIFDFQKSYFYYWKYRKNFLNLEKNKKFSKLIFPLNKIDVIQILKKELKEKWWKNSQTYTYNCYELNLILNDNSRINILNHGNLNKIKETAQLLSQRLWVKVYDLTQVLENESY